MPRTFFENTALDGNVRIVGVEIQYKVRTIPHSVQSGMLYHAVLLCWPFDVLAVMVVLVV